jgi:hypothetical protein
MRTIPIGIATFGLGLLAACGNDIGTDTPDAAPVVRTTWYQDVAPIAAKHCMSCHQDGGIAPFALTEYMDAHDNASRMLAKVKSGEMPPFDAREEADCTPRFGWKDDPRLTAAEIQTLQDWLDDGAPEGTPAAIPAIPSTALPGITMSIKPTVAFTASGDTDQFICFLLDPGAAQGTWLTGMQVNPDNDAVVHHVVISEIPPSTDLDAMVAAHPVGTPFACDQLTQATGAFTVGLWTPGNQPMQTPADLAVPIVGGSKFLMNIHYHPTGGINAPDATSIDLRTSTVWPKKMYFVAGFGNAFTSPTLLPDVDDRTATVEFRVPANKADHTEHMRFTLPALPPSLRNVRLYSAMPHMHLVGTHVAGRIERPAARGNDPQNECLANGKWNFDWQRSYIYDTDLDSLPSVQGGDVFDIQCHWDNTMTNPFVQRLLHDQHLVAPIDIDLGEETTNEMCLEIFGLAIDAPAPPVAPRVVRVSDLPMADIARMSSLR